MAPWTDVDWLYQVDYAQVCMSLHEQKWQWQVFMDTCETTLKWPKRPVTMATGKWIPAKAWVRLHESKEDFEFHVTAHWHSHAPHVCKRTVQNTVQDVEQETSGKYEVYWAQTFHFQKKAFSGNKFPPTVQKCHMIQRTWCNEYRTMQTILSQILI